MDINSLWSGYDLNSKKQNSRCLSVNTILEGKYLVGPVLGQGGFGITYVGYDLNMETKIAIKEYFPVELVSRDTTTIHGDRVLSLGGEKSVTYQQGLKKYVAEAQNVSQFSEVPGIVSVKDFFYANETAYIVMEFIDGISLKDYLKERGGRLSEEETLKIMKPVLEALVQVHKAGIIHRDISPDNIMLTFGNDNKIKDVKLIDFGAARMTAKNDQKSLTIILKHGYAPEEQYRTHGEQGPWTDVYAICATMYRMLTGETPVPAMDRLFQDELKTLEQCGAKVSANTSAAILKGLAVKKDDRIQSVQELIGALYEGTKIKAAKGKKSAVGTAASNRKTKNTALIAGIGAVVVLAAVGGKLAGEANQNRVIAEESTDLPPGQNEVSVQENFSDMGVGQNGAEEVLVNADAEEELGEQIVFYDPMRSAAVSDFGSHVLFCMPDGTVKARGVNDEGQCDVELWDHVAAVEVGGYAASFGLRTDGTVLYAGTETSGYDQVELWTDIIDVQSSNSFVVGLKNDGTVVVEGNIKEIFGEVSNWSHVKAIATWLDSVYGLTEDGQILSAGMNPAETVAGWTDVERIAVCMGTIYGFCEDGAVRMSPVDRSNWVYNYNNKEFLDESLIFYGNELGVKTDGNVFVEFGRVPAEVERWSDLQAIINVGDTIYFGLQKDGTILECYDCEGTDSPDTMKNLAWVQSFSEEQYGLDSLYAVSNDNKVYAYGNNDLKENLLSYGDTVTWYNGHAALYEDGTALIETTRDGDVEKFSGVQQLEEMVWNMRYDNDGGGSVQCAYVMLMKDGTVRRYQHGLDSKEDVMALEQYEYYADVESWSDVVQIDAAGEWHVYGLTADGRLLYAGPEEFTEVNQIMEHCIQVQVNEDSTNVFYLTETGTLKRLFNNRDERGISNADGWTDIKQFALSNSHIAALQTDGTVKAVGSNHCGQCDVEEWQDVVYITVGKNCTLGITSDGELLMAGSLY